jgi:Domain of unknown function (DUF4397)
MKSLVKTFTNIVALALPTAIFSSCALDVINPPVNAQLMVLNLAPVASSATVGVPPLQLNADGKDMLMDSIRNGGGVGYVSFTAGTRTVKLTARNNNTRFGITQGKEYANFSYNGVLKEYTSAFVVSEVATNDKFAVVLAKDDLTAPKANTTKIRFAHFVAGAPNVDVWISAGPAGAGTAPIVSGLKFKDVSNFIELPSVPAAVGTTPRSNYTFVLRAAGDPATGAVLSTIAATSTSTAVSTTPQILENGRIMTVAVTGTGTRLGILNDRQ